MNDNLKRVKALELLMPLGGYNDSKGIITIYADGIANGYSVPPQAEIDTAIAIIEAEEAATAYQKLRKAEYPDLGDQFDVIWKQLNQMRLNGTPLIQEADDMLGSILATKARRPKP